MSTLWKNIALSWARAILMAASGSAVTDGLITGDQQNQIVGGGLAVVVLALAAWDKFHAKRAIENAAATGVAK